MKWDVLKSLGWLTAGFGTFLFLSGCVSSKLYERYSHLQSGRLYLNKCTSCHQVRKVEAYSFDKWKAIVNEHSQVESGEKTRQRRKRIFELSAIEHKAILAIHSQVEELLLKENLLADKNNQPLKPPM